MKKINYLFVILSCMLFVPKVSALSYDIGTQLIDTSNGEYEIKVSLRNIKDTSYGVAACSMQIKLDGDIVLNTGIRTLSSWTKTGDGFYVFDTSNPALTNTDFIVIPVKASGNGTVNLNEIRCSDDTEEISVGNKSVSITYTPATSNNNNGGNNGNTGNNSNNNADNKGQIVKDSNCDLSEIKLSEGVIEFDASITEYSITVSEFDNLVVEPKVVSNKASFTIDKGDNEVIIKVKAEDGSTKTYTIYVEETNEEVNEETEKEIKKKNNYTPIFIGIICVLVLINVFRIVINKKNKG